MQKDVTLNNDQRMYVIPCGDGYTCWGFDNCFRETCQLAEALGKPAPSHSEIGLMSVYIYHEDLIKHVFANKIDLGTWFDNGTDPVVKSVLEAARIEDLKVRIFLGNTDPSKPDLGKSWMEEHDVYGRIGRSTGVLKVPLLVPIGDDGGSAISTRSIVKIIKCVGNTKMITLYEHPAFHLPEMRLAYETREDMLSKGYVMGVDADGVRHANFRTLKKAQDWIEFMSGRRMKP